MRAPLVLVMVMAVGCGTVTADPPTAAGGAGGASRGTGGQGGGVQPMSGAGGQPMSGTGGQGGAACLPSGGVLGFAYNAPCDASIVENASDLAPWLSACRANCVLNGAQFIGCSEDSRIDAGVVICRASCSSCP